MCQDHQIRPTKTRQLQTDNQYNSKSFDFVSVAFVYKQTSFHHVLTYGKSLGSLLKWFDYQFIMKKLSSMVPLPYSVVQSKRPISCICSLSYHKWKIKRDDKMRILECTHEVTCVFLQFPNSLSHRSILQCHFAYNGCGTS